MLGTMPKRHEGRTVIVTGAGAGLGRATAVQFVQEGAHVVGVDISARDLDDVATELGSAMTPVVASVASATDVQNIVGAAAGVNDRIDVLVNNAAVLDGLAPVDECDEETWDWVLAVNLKGP